MQEVLRLNSNGSFTSSTDIEEFLQHVSNISQPHFHQELFCLIVYNLSMKQGMLRTARWKVRNKCDAKELAQELTMEDVSAAISTRVLSEGRKRKNGD
jgi:phosphoribosylformimino-5-aminoimidazole carboxamide ribonucleotide (ProFAR) isomerase